MFDLYDRLGYELRWRHGFEGAAELPAGFATLGARSRANVQATNFYLSKWPAAA